ARWRRAEVCDFYRSACPASRRSRRGRAARGKPRPGRAVAGRKGASFGVLLLRGRGRRRVGIRLAEQIRRNADGESQKTADYISEQMVKLLALSHQILMILLQRRDDFIGGVVGRITHKAAALGDYFIGNVSRLAVEIVRPAGA